MEEPELQHKTGKGQKEVLEDDEHKSLPNSLELGSGRSELLI